MPTSICSSVAQIAQHFYSRTDIVAVGIDGGPPSPCRGLSVDTLHGLIQASITGDAIIVDGLGGLGNEPYSATGVPRVGTYTIDPLTQTCSHCCIDIDGKGHKQAVKDPQALLKWFVEALGKDGIPCYGEISGGGHGRHIWVFFDHEPAAKLRAWWQAIASKIPRELLELAEPVKNAEGEVVKTHVDTIEFFPKADTIKEGSTGNMVWIPFASGLAPNGGRMFTADDREIIVTEEGLKLKANGIGSDEPFSFELATIPNVPVPPTPPQKKGSPNQQRQEVLNKLDLVAWYNRNGEEVLVDPDTTEKRSPARDTRDGRADENPSASIWVAQSDDEHERGYFVVHGGNGPDAHMSAFDWAVGKGYYANFQEAYADACLKTGVVTAVPPPHPSFTAPTIGHYEAEEVVFSPADTATVMRWIPGPDEVVYDPFYKDAGEDRYPEAMARLLLKNTHDVIFNMGGEVVVRAGDQFAPLTVPTLTHLVQKTSRFITITQATATIVKVMWDKRKLKDIPEKYIKGALVVLERDIGILPQIETITSIPQFTTDGQLLATPGCHPELKLFLRSDVVNPKLGKDPVKAVEYIEALYEDFFIVKGKHHALAFTILPYLRALITGPWPYKLNSAAQISAGKSLEAKAVYASNGIEPAELKYLKGDEKSNAQNILTALGTNSDGVFIDDVSETLRSSEFNKLASNVTFSDRRLYSQTPLEYSTRKVKIITKNTSDVSEDIARRSLHTQFVRRSSNASVDDYDYAHKDLLAHVAKIRPHLMSAACTIIKHWVDQRMPMKTGILLKGFENFSQVIGGILECVGIDDWLDDSVTTESDLASTAMEWDTLAEEWYLKFGTDWVSSKAILSNLSSEVIREVVGAKEAPTGTRLTQCLKRNDKRRIGAYTLHARRYQGKFEFSMSCGHQAPGAQIVPFPASGPIVDAMCSWWAACGPNAIAEQDAVERFGLSQKAIRAAVGQQLPCGFSLVQQAPDTAVPFPTYTLSNPALESFDLSGLDEQDILVLLQHDLITETEPDAEGEVTFSVNQ